jgi:tripartite-type tricarboxylate transporter receptor subunit TctC
MRDPLLKCIAGVLGVASLGISAGWAQSYPTKPVRLIIGYEPGGGADNIARLWAASASEALGQQIVVDNRSGANGVVAAELVSRGQRDGYTIHVVTSSHVTNPSVYPKLPYDTARDFTAVTEIADTPSGDGRSSVDEGVERRRVHHCCEGW